MDLEIFCMLNATCSKTIYMYRVHMDADVGSGVCVCVERRRLMVWWLLSILFFVLLLWPLLLHSSFNAIWCLSPAKGRRRAFGMHMHNVSHKIVSMRAAAEAVLVMVVDLVCVWEFLSFFKLLPFLPSPLVPNPHGKWQMLMAWDIEIIDSSLRATIWIHGRVENSKRPTVDI